MSDRWTWHGGGLAAARGHFGEGGSGDEQAWIDLSTGINPHAWAVPVQSFDWARLPDEREVEALEQAAASAFGIDPRFVCAVPGTEIALRMMDRLISGPAHHLVPSYRTHGEMLEHSDPVTRDRLGEADGATLILANPNNPDGRVLDRQALRDLLARRGPAGWLLIDEAFVDCDPAISVADLIGEHQRLVVFRSFGKFFGLAGVRLGFVLGPPALLERVRHRLGAWPLSAPAIAIGSSAYRDHAWIRATRQRLAADAADLDRVLRAAGLQPTGACPLFRLAEVEDARRLFEALARRAILTRPFASNPHWLRIGLPESEAALDRLQQALNHG